jgi:ABC-2 type transport system permease protein
MSRIDHYYKVFEQHALNSVSKLMSFRLNFVLSTIVEFASICIGYLTIDILFRHLEQIGPWGRSEFMLFSCWLQMLGCVHSSIAAPNFWNFSAELQNGNLDYRLLRPIGALFNCFTAIMRPAALLVLPVHLGLFIYFGLQVNLSVLAWCSFPALFALSYALTMLTELSVSMGMFWTIRGDGINFLRMQGQQLQRWPDFIYPLSIRSIFTYLFPVLMTTSMAIRFLLDPSRWQEVFALIVGVLVFWFVVSRLWALGLRRYESASS